MTHYGLPWNANKYNYIVYSFNSVLYCLDMILSFKILKKKNTYWVFENNNTNIKNFKNIKKTRKTYFKSRALLLFETILFILLLKDNLQKCYCIFVIQISWLILDFRENQNTQMRKITFNSVHYYLNILSHHMIFKKRDRENILILFSKTTVEIKYWKSKTIKTKKKRTLLLVIRFLLFETRLLTFLSH